MSLQFRNGGQWHSPCPMGFTMGLPNALPGLGSNGNDMLHWVTPMPIGHAEASPIAPRSPLPRMPKDAIKRPASMRERMG